MYQDHHGKMSLRVFFLLALCLTTAIFGLTRYFSESFRSLTPIPTLSSAAVNPQQAVDLYSESTPAFLVRQDDFSSTLYFDKGYWGEPISIMFSDVRGDIILKLDGEIVFDSKDENYIHSVARLRTILTPLDFKAKEQELTQMDIELDPKGLPFPRMGTVYIDSNQNVLDTLGFDFFYYHEMRVISFSLFGFAALGFAMLVISGAVSLREVTALGGILAFVLIVNIGDVLQLNGINFETYRLISFFPLVIVFLWIFYRDLISAPAYLIPDFYRYLLGFIAVTIIFAVLPVNTRQLSALLLAPFSLLMMLLFLVFIVIQYFKTRIFGVGLLAIICLLLFFAILNDTLTHVGLIKGSILLLRLVLVTIVFLLIFLFSKRVFALKTQAESSADYLKQETAHLKSELESEYKRREDSIKQFAADDARREFELELHDGVSTYLSIIQFLSDKPDADNIANIKKLSKFAQNEMRIILNSTRDHDHSLLKSLTTLKSHIVDPLVSSGLKVEWRLYALLDYQCRNGFELLSIIRIAQEAIHNATQRSGAKWISFTAEQQGERYTLVLTNGGGSKYDPESSKGVGVRGMYERAEKMGASLELQPTSDGARLVLTLPASQNRER